MLTDKILKEFPNCKNAETKKSYLEIIKNFCFMNKVEIYYLEKILEAYPESTYLFESYLKCVEEKIITKENGHLILEFLKLFRFLDINLLKGYLLHFCSLEGEVYILLSIF